MQYFPIAKYISARETFFSEFRQTWICCDVVQTLCSSLRRAVLESLRDLCVSTILNVRYNWSPYQICANEVALESPAEVLLLGAVAVGPALEGHAGRHELGPGLRVPGFHF